MAASAGALSAAGGVVAPAAGLPTRAEVMAQAREENFPVALWLLGPRLRRHLLAVYGFARLVDDVGDEVPGDRLALLHQLERELDAPRHPVMVELARTVQETGLPREPFLRLIEANRRDQRATRYETIDELLDYCRLSAAPIGELVLHLIGAATPQRIALSDRVCAALQVIEHLQDVEEDAARGRTYIGPFDARGQARALLAAGPPLVRTLRGRARLAVAGFVAGGRLALDRLEAAEARDRADPVGDRGRAAFVAAYARAVAGR